MLVLSTYKLNIQKVKNKNKTKTELSVTNLGDGVVNQCLEFGAGPGSSPPTVASDGAR